MKSPSRIRRLASASTSPLMPLLALDTISLIFFPNIPLPWLNRKVCNGAAILLHQRCCHNHRSVVLKFNVHWIDSRIGRGVGLDFHGWRQSGYCLWHNCSQRNLILSLPVPRGQHLHLFVSADPSQSCACCS